MNEEDKEIAAAVSLLFVGIGILLYLGYAVWCI